MKHATLSDRLNYNAYIDAAGSVIWGDGTSSTSTVSLKNVTKNKPRTVTAYGVIPALQAVAVGAYSDLLTVTIVW